MNHLEKAECKKIAKTGEFFVKQFHRNTDGSNLLFPERETRLRTVEEAFAAGKRAAQSIDIRLMRAALDGIAVGLGSWTPQQRRLYERASRQIEKCGY